MNHTAASGTTSSPELPLSTSVVSNSRQPTSSETVPLADRSTIYRSHDYEELPASSYENPDYGYYAARGEECAMLASSADSHSPVGESNVIGTPVSSLHSSLMTSGDDQSTLLGRQSRQGFRKRVNPLYCTVPTSQSKKTGRGAPSLAVCMAMCVSGAAILLAVLACVMVVGVVHESRSVHDTASMQMRLEALEQRYNMLVKVLNGTGSKEDGGDVQLMRNSLFAELRSEFHDGMSELKDEMSGKILNTSRQLSVAVGNVMSRCEHKKVSYGSAADIPSHATEWRPNSMQEANNWNSLPVYLQSSPSLFKFRQQLKTYLFQQ